LVRAAEQYIVLKILGARYNEQAVYHELLVAWRGSPVGEATWEPYSVMAVDVPEIIPKFMEFRDDLDVVSEMRSV
jgi:Chromo (CHRromatin Organisation MOdifier) domain